MYKKKFVWHTPHYPPPPPPEQQLPPLISPHTTQKWEGGIPYLLYIYHSCFYISNTQIYRISPERTVPLQRLFLCKNLCREKNWMLIRIRAYASKQKAAMTRILWGAHKIALYKKVSDFPVPSRDVTNQTAPGVEYCN
jgi:hypothetical protein